MLKELNFNPTNICGGGYEITSYKQTSKIGGQCSPSMHEGWCLAR